MLRLVRLRRWLTPKDGAGWTLAISVACLVVACAVFSRVRAPTLVTGAAFVVPIFALALAVLVRARLGFSTIAVIMGGLCLYGAYFTYTGYGERNFDGGSQLEYVRYIVDHGGRLPTPKTCFVCHHPPAYYLTAAATYRFFQWSHLWNPVRGAQLVSLVATFVFLLFGALTIRRFVESPRRVALATALITFWPYTVINSVRLHNDVAVGALMVAGQFFLVRWYQENKGRDLWWAAALAVASLLTKSNGYAFVATLFFVVAWRFVFQSGRFALVKKAAAPLLAVVLAAGAFTLHRRNLEDGDVSHGMLGTAYEILPRDFTPNEPGNYLYFDLETFLKEPYVMARTDGTGRENYWNHVLKSSLFSTHNTVADAETSYRWNRRIAEVMSFLLLAMLTFGASGLFFAKREAVRKYLVLMVGAVLLFAAHIAFKATIPSGHHADFRFVYPVLIPGSIAFAKVIDGFEKRGLLLASAGKTLGLVFVTLTILYYVPKHDFVLRYLPLHVVRRSEAAVKTARPERTPFDDAKLTRILSDEVLEIEIGKKKIRHLEVSLDFNDRYSIELVGRTETREIVVGNRAEELKRAGKPPGEEATTEATRVVEPTEPDESSSSMETDGDTTSDASSKRIVPKKMPKPENKKPFKGLAIYTRDLETPIEGVTLVRIRPLSGDRNYALGHLTLK
jgi:hypothetical protein